MTTTSYTLEVKGKTPFVVLQLKQYEAMLEYMEELEDRADLRDRKEEENIPWIKVKDEIAEKLAQK